MAYYIIPIGAALGGGWLMWKKPEWRKYQWAFLAGVGVVCWLLASLRYQVGFDYRFYETIFETAAGTSLRELFQIEHLEPGYLLLNKLVAFCGGGYRAFLFVFHFLLTAVFFYWMGRYSENPWLSLYLFITLQFFALSMNLLRQAMAAAIFLLSYRFLRERRFLPYCGIVLLAACFHRTVLIMLPFYFLLGLRVDKWHYGIAGAVTAAAYFAMDPLIQIAVTVFPDYRQYLSSKYWQGNSFLYILMPLGCLLFALPLFRGAFHFKEPHPILANGIFYYFLMSLFITRHFVLERMSIYLSLYVLLALPRAALVKGRGLTEKLRTAILLAGGTLYFLFAATQGFHDVYPYIGIWRRATGL